MWLIIHLIRFMSMSSDVKAVQRAMFSEEQRTSMPNKYRFVCCDAVEWYNFLINHNHWWCVLIAPSTCTFYVYSIYLLCPQPVSWLLLPLVAVKCRKGKLKLIIYLMTPVSYAKCTDTALFDHLVYMPFLLESLCSYYLFFLSYFHWSDHCFNTTIFFMPFWWSC